MTASLPGSSPVTPRAALAEIAAGVVARMPGVALSGAGDSRPRSAGAGIMAVAQGEGRFELSLQIVVAWPLGPLSRRADDLRRRVRAAVKRARLEDRLGEVRIEIVGIEEPEEVRGRSAPGQ